METTFFALANKNNFNLALRHFYKVTDLVDEIESKKNLADLVNEEIEEIHPDQILPLIGAIIRDKFNYSYDSFNIPLTISEFNKIAEETAKWTALDIIIVYYNPRGKIILINPKNMEHFERINELVRDQLIVVYAKCLKEEDKKIELESISTIEEMIAGKDVFINKKFIDQTVAPKVPVKQKKPKEGATKKRVTPRYAIQVSNELFHNGNVEAWKKIIESFNHKYPDLEVSVFFEGEVINDINSLFKWGKVKHGDSIFFQVGGEDIKGVSKLQKYLYEGASHRFEQFLKVGVGKVLNLF